MGRHTLTIGITTFNRRQILEAMARSLAQVDGLEHAHVWVLDDCSEEFDADFLRRLFPRAEVFRAFEHSGGADQGMKARDLDICPAGIDARHRGTEAP